MAQTSYFPAGDAVFGEGWGEDKVYDVGLGGAVAAGGRDDGDFVFVGKEQKVAGFDRSQEAFGVAS